MGGMKLCFKMHMQIWILSHFYDLERFLWTAGGSLPLPVFPLPALQLPALQLPHSRLLIARRLPKQPVCPRKDRSDMMSLSLGMEDPRLGDAVDGSTVMPQPSWVGLGSNPCSVYLFGEASLRTHEHPVLMEHGPKKLIRENSWTVLHVHQP